MNATRIGAVFFDAVGTLIHPEPSAAAAYADVGRRFGSRLDLEAIRQRFRAAFQWQEEVDRGNDWRTSGPREVERWQCIVREVLSDVADVEGCFAALYEHFAVPRNWRCDPQAAGVLMELTRRGVVGGVASNFDERLRRVLAGWPALTRLEHVIVSAEIGWRKPAPQFFQALAAAAALPPKQILYVGDDLVNDFDGARAGGLHAVLFGGGSRTAHAGTSSIANLRELLDLDNLPHRGGSL